MNARCINCTCIRTEVKLRAGWAQADFVCTKRQLRHTHLKPGPRLKCHAQREENVLPEEAFSIPEYTSK